MPVCLDPTEKLSELSYIGTSGTFGAFAGNTRLLASNGKHRQVRHLVATGNVADVSFERVSRLAQTSGHVVSVDEVWPTLLRAAVMHENGWLALKCRSDRRSEGFQRVFSQIENIGPHSYCFVNRDRLRDALRNNWCMTIVELGKCWLRDNDERRIEVERDYSDFMLHYITALACLGIGYRLQYDCLQHTACVYVCDAEALPPPVVRGSCAFFAPIRCQTIQLSWREPSWTPISGGLLLACD